MTEKNELKLSFKNDWPLFIVLLICLAAGGFAYLRETSPEYIEAQKEASAPRNERMLGHEAVLPDELKGCKVFRLFDGKKSLYLTSCTDTVTTQWTESCGKNCFRQESATTQRRGDI